MSSCKLHEKNALILAIFSFLALMIFSGGKASAAVQLSTTFPDPNTTSISTNRPPSPSPLYLTVGEGEFSAHSAGATILSDSPGTFYLIVDHAGWCNNDLDLPKEFAQAYKKTNFSVWSVTGSSGTYSLSSKKTEATTGYVEDCNSSSNDVTLSFKLDSSDYNTTIKKYVAVAFGSQLFQAANPAYGKAVPTASENSFRFIVSGPGNPGMTFVPPSTLGSLYNFSNRNRSSASQLSSGIILNTPCNLAKQDVTIQFFDVDNGLYQSTGSGNYNFPLNFSVKRSDTRGVAPTINVISPTKITGGDGQQSQIFTISLERSYTYEFRVSGLSAPNAITFKFSTNVDPLFGSSECNTPPTGSINVSCSATGLVTISSATITDSQGGAMEITATKPGGAVATGSGSVTANRATNINFTSSNTFNGTKDGVTRTISGKVTDPEGLASDISGTYKCDPPPLAISCILSDITIELGDSASSRMTISRTDTNNSAISVIPAIVVNGRTYTNPAVSLNASSSSDQTFQSVTLTEEKSYDVSGTVKRQSDNTTLATCTSTINVVRKPFFKVSGGDLMVGAAYPTTSPTSCTGSTVGNVSSWATVNSATDRKGANVSAMSQILGTAKDFYSAGSTAPPSFPKKWLTIANNTGEWGSAYGQVSCMKDMYALTKKTTSKTIPSPYKPSSATSTDNQVVYSGNLELRGESNFTGKLAIYVTGNVYITEDIIMNSTYTNGISDIPFFALIVRGNIYVKSTVQRLDGLYVAQPRTDNSGNFIASTGSLYTCASAANTPVVIASIFSSCSSPLTINGIVQAKDLKLHRTSGTLKNNSSAEVFNNLPELYLAQTPFRDSASANTLYDSAASLPPSL